MRILFLFTVLFVVRFSLTAKPSSTQKINSNIIAVYNIDSVVVKMAEYADAKKKYYAYYSLIRQEDSLINAAYIKMAVSFATDSGKFSPVVYALKKKEIEIMSDRIADFNAAAQTDLENKKKELLAPLCEK